MIFQVAVPKNVDTKLYMLSNSILFSTIKSDWTKIKYSSVLSMDLLCQMSCKSIILFRRWHVQQNLSMRHCIQNIWKSMFIWCMYKVYEVLPKIFENLDIPRKPIALRTWTARCLLLYLSTVSQPSGVFISAHVSKFWLFSLHRFHVCQIISKWRMLRSKEFGLNFASSSTKLQLKPTKC